MPTFRFQAMDTAGKCQTGRIDAENADAAQNTLRGRGLFVTTLVESPASEAVKNVTTSSQPAGLRWATVLGLVVLLAGLYGTLDSLWFSWRAERVNATFVDLDQSGGNEGAVSVLEFTVAGRSYRVHARGAYGVQWGSSGWTTPTPLLYPPDHPEQARLADFKARFFVPLFLLIIGALFTAGIFNVRRRHYRDVSCLAGDI